MPLVKNKTSLRARLNRRLEKTGDSEPEQAKLRLVIGIIIIAYIGLSLHWGDSSFQDVDTYVTLTTFVFYLCAVIIFASIVIKPVTSPARRVLGMLADLVSLSVLMYFSGEYSISLFVIYLWVILGNGFRYGVRYLYIALCIAITGFISVFATSDFWLSNVSFGISLLLILCLVPLYSSFLIKKLNAAIDLAKQANEAKTRFLANMSHGLRTPLNGVIGIGELLQETDMNVEQKELVNVMHGSANTLLELIENVLDISKIEAGKIELNIKDIDLHSLVNSIIYILASSGKKKGLPVSCHFDPEIPFAVKGDEQRLKQVLINLINNAIKFTNNGHVKLSIKPAQTFSEERPVIRFEIEDTGIGILKESQDKIFNHFTQADASISRSFGGSGLGTTISKELVELMGGEIGVESIQHQGSVFWFELPMQKSENGQYNLSNKKVLLLASEESAAITWPFLEGWRIKFDWVQSSTRAVSMLLQANDQHKAYDILVADQHCLRSINAVQFAKMLESEGLTESMSLILINASDTIIDANQINQLYISTIDNADDKTLLFNALHAAQSKNIEGSNIIAMAEHYGRFSGVQSLNILVAEDNIVNQQVIEGILRKAGHTVLLCDTGDKALSLLSSSLESIDMLILDMNMPEISGLDVVKSLRYIDTSAKIPVIMLTADATPEARQISLSAGVNSFLTKPINAREVLKEIATLSQQPIDQQADQQANPKLGQYIDINQNEKASDYESSASNFHESSWYDHNVLQELYILGEDSKFIVSLLKNFKIEAMMHLDKIQMAVDDDYLQYREELHAIKGSAAELGAQQLVTICEAGEALKPYDIGTDKTRQIYTELKAILVSTCHAFDHSLIEKTQSNGEPTRPTKT